MVLPARPNLADPAPTDRGSLDALAKGFRYFNVAGSGPTMPVARTAMESFGRWIDAVGMFSHVGYDAYNEELSATRADVARMLGDADCRERVALLQSATAALNVVVSGLRLARRARFVTTDQEHASALLPQFARRERGDEVVVVPYHGDDEGFLQSVRDALRPGGVLLLSHVSHRNGAILPVRAACALARERDCFAIVDGAQALGQIQVDVLAMGADAYCFLGHKWLHGPLGTGGLWLRAPTDESLSPTTVGWRSQVASDRAGRVTFKESAERFESGTVDVAAYVGLRQTFAVHRRLGVDVVAARIAALRSRLLSGLAALPGRILSRENDRTGIVTYQPPQRDVSALVMRLWTESRVMVKALVPGEPDAIRISFWYLHEDSAIDELLAALRACVRVGLR